MMLLLGLWRRVAGERIVKDGSQNRPLTNRGSRVQEGAEGQAFPAQEKMVSY